MNKKILISLSVIGAVAAIAIGGTIAYFSDTETSTGNTFTAGTIDISINDQNPWQDSFAMADMKPSYTDYINFTIQNFGSDPNPVDVYKRLILGDETTGAQTEPECTEEEGTWDNGTKTCADMKVEKNNISTAILYDLYVKVYDKTQNLIWWQAIYTEDVTVAGIASQDIYLGMIPAGGYMEVKQSYHMDKNTTNWAQGDIMNFSIEIKAEQLQGTVVLENKSGDPDWKILGDDTIQGTLTYKVKNPTFNFSFTGKAPLGDKSYCLWIGGTPKAGDWDADTKIGCDMSNSEGNVEISGNPDLGKDVKDGKAWLILESDYNGSWLAWSPASYLWETGLIWYDDTDL